MKQLEEFINEEFNPDFYDNDIQIPPEIRNAFDNNDSEKKKPLHNERIRNLRLVSDLLPWILSFIVLAFMAYYFTEDRKYLIERTKEVNLAQQHLLNLYEQRIKDVENLYDKVLNVRVLKED